MTSLCHVHIEMIFALSETVHMNNTHTHLHTLHTCTDAMMRSARVHPCKPSCVPTCISKLPWWLNVCIYIYIYISNECFTSKLGWNALGPGARASIVHQTVQERYHDRWPFTLRPAEEAAGRRSFRLVGCQPRRGVGFVALEVYVFV